MSGRERVRQQMHDRYARHAHGASIKSASRSVCVPEQKTRAAQRLVFLLVSKAPGCFDTDADSGGGTPPGSAAPELSRQSYEPNLRVTAFARQTLALFSPLPPAQSFFRSPFLRYAAIGIE